MNMHYINKQLLLDQIFWDFVFEKGEYNAKWTGKIKIWKRCIVFIYSKML